MTDTVGTLVKDTDAFDPVLIELPRVVLSRVRDSRLYVVKITSLSQDEFVKESEHISLQLNYKPRQRPAVEDIENPDEVKSAYYRLTWRDLEGPFFDLARDEVSCGNVCPRWYDSFCAKLSNYVRGFTVNSSWELVSYGTKIPDKLGGMFEDVPVTESPFEQAYFHLLEKQAAQTQLLLNFDSSAISQPPIIQVSEWDR